MSDKRHHKMTPVEKIGYMQQKMATAKSFESPVLTVPIADLEIVMAALEDKDARTAACVNAFEGIETERIAGKNLGEFLAGEVRLNKAEPKPDGSFGFTFSGFAVQIMAEAFADQFKSSGAVNYLELLFEHKDIGPLTVTMQRIEGLTPAQKLAAAQQREEHLKADVAILKALAAELLAVREAQSLSAGTQFKPVADLYEMQFEDGHTCAFHTDAEKAIQWLNTCDGNKVQEYVKLERLQEAFTAPPAPAVLDERAAFNAWNNEDNLPIAGVPAKNAAWLAWQARAALQAGNSPVIPDGWKLVPADPTEDMVAAAMMCDDVEFNSDETFCVNFGNIYSAMMAAAPTPTKPE